MKSGRRTAAPLFLALAAASATGCFALFSLDEFGPPGAPVDGAAAADVVEASAKPPDAAPVDTRPKKRVFVTSTTSNGNLGGLSGADERCQRLATEAGLNGTFKAWLSIDNEAPRTRYFRDAGTKGEPAPTPPDVRIVDTTGRTVAESWSQLFSPKPPLVPIEYTERGVKLNAADAGVKSTDQAGNCAAAMGGGNVTPFLPVWTNTKSDGTPINTEDDCENYETNNGTTRIGIVASDAGWSDRCTYACNQVARLYCFEQ